MITYRIFFVAILPVGSGAISKFYIITNTNKKKQTDEIKMGPAFINSHYIVYSPPSVS